MESFFLLQDVSCIMCDIGRVGGMRFLLRVGTSDAFS